MKSLYKELAEKEQALILAAQFGNNLIEEKENLERQMESNRRDQLNQIEVNATIITNSLIRKKTLSKVSNSLR